MSRRGSHGTAFALAWICAACIPLRDPWPESESLARAADTRWPTLAVSVLRSRDGGAPEPFAPPGYGPQERLVRAMRTTDLFRSVRVTPALAEWHARIVVGASEKSDFTSTSLVLESADGETLFEGTRRGEGRFGYLDRKDPVPDLVRELLVEARERGVFAGGAR